MNKTLLLMPLLALTTSYSIANTKLRNKHYPLNLSIVHINDHHSHLEPNDLKLVDTLK